MRVPYYCPYCHHRSTRRWNLDVHIKRKHGDRLSANNPPLYSKRFQLGHATVADSVVDTFQPRYTPQQMPLDVMQYSANPMYPPTQIMDGQGTDNGTRLSPETILKIAELKRLVNKYPQFHTIDADEIVKWAIYCSSNGDSKFLDDMLNQLRTIDSLAKY